MVNFMLIIGATVLITVIGGGIGALLFYLGKPKKQVWKAKVYQLGRGTRQIVDSKGNCVESGLKLSDLKPYCIDTLEKKDVDHGITVYELSSLKMTTGAVNADLVEVWDKSGQNKEVDVLIKDGNATLLSRGYDNETGEKIFQPMPRERIEMINSEREIKKNRLVKQKDIIQAIAPFVVAGICVVGLIVITYLIASSWVKASEIQKETAIISSDSQTETAQIYRDAASFMKGLPIKSELDESGGGLGVQDG